MIRTFIVAGRDREITQDDVRRAIESASAIQLPAGREIVDRLPQEFIVDDQDGINDPVGMIGARLAVKVHIVTSPVTARQNVINAVNRAGLVVGEMVLEQLAAAEASLTDDDKEFGAALVDIGAETTGLVIYQRGAVQHTAVFALGGSHFTNDIAFGLRTPIPEAEKIKRTVGWRRSCAAQRVERGELVEVPSVGGRAPRQLSRQILCDILQPRAEEVLMHVADEIRESGWERSTVERRGADRRRRAARRHGRDRRAGLRRASAHRLSRARSVRRTCRRHSKPGLGGRGGSRTRFATRAELRNAALGTRECAAEADSARSFRNFAIVLVVFSE